MINHRISADWSTTKPIAEFSCTPRVQRVHTKAEVLHLTLGLLGLGVLCNSQAEEMYWETYDKHNNICRLEYDKADCSILLYTTFRRRTYQS